MRLAGACAGVVGLLAAASVAAAAGGRGGGGHITMTPMTSTGGHISTMTTTSTSSGAIGPNGAGTPPWMTAQLGPTHPTGQPSQSCGSADAMTRPGNAMNAPGSAFNPMGQAGSVYAGQQPQNSKNVSSVAQYDVACFNNSR
jgi:hypothetical protein